MDKKDFKFLRVRIIALFLTAPVIALLVVTISKINYFEYFLVNQSKDAKWNVISTLPMIKGDETPQAIEMVDAFLLMGVSETDAQTKIYFLDSDKSYEASDIVFEMPGNAQHTSGFSLEGQYLWAGDYYNNILYRIDVSTAPSSELPVVNEVVTGLSGLSSVASFEYEGIKYLAVTDFLGSRSSYFLDVNKLVETNSFSDSVIFSYRSTGLNQGIVYYEGKIIESVNQFGQDKLVALEFSKLLSALSAESNSLAYSSYQEAIVCIFNAPAKMVEDLAIEEDVLYTSDEETNKIYSIPLQETCLK